VAGADPYNLQRFVDAQNPVFERVCAELRAGRKTSHWMWFIFPQIRGLGRSSTALHFAICSLEEAEAYLQHAVLGPRLRHCTSQVNAVQDSTAEQIFGYPDYLKFRSSMTLFKSAATDSRIFQQALDKFFAGEPDPLTLDHLQQRRPASN
jgi:uncharacterized protein (DUF1810 family)